MGWMIVQPIYELSGYFIQIGGMDVLKDYVYVGSDKAIKLALKISDLFFTQKVKKYFFKYYIIKLSIDKQVNRDGRRANG